MPNGENQKKTRIKPVIDHFREIDLQSPAEIIIQQIKDTSDAGSLLGLDTTGITLAKKSIQTFVSETLNHG